jgi:hypothetical protein
MRRNLIWLRHLTMLCQWPWRPAATSCRACRATALFAHPKKGNGSRCHSVRAAMNELVCRQDGFRILKIHKAMEYLDAGNSSHCFGICHRGKTQRYGHGHGKPILGYIFAPAMGRVSDPCGGAPKSQPFTYSSCDPSRCTRCIHARWNSHRDPGRKSIW